eukprot:TRINITY_DN15438_c0_g1_i1.p1 TRINITY_DN15438_c0_g1~~TRINITY_DN15438_c0_g1_i1.p1  ORF type:complete len:508 (+),score=65.79 TRINITY_DN15438_c0_g1_i1:83-1606(+)
MADLEQPPLSQTALRPSEHDESVRDLKRHLRAELASDDGPIRSNSDVGPMRDVVTASQLAVPGGFRRNFVAASCGADRPEAVEMRQSLISQLTDPLRSFPQLLDDMDEDLKASRRASFAEGGGSSNTVTTFIIVKTFLAGAVLIIPKSYSLTGVLAGPVITIVIGYLCVYCMLLLVKCREAYGRATYSELAGCLGGWAPKVVKTLVVLSQFGFACAEQIYVCKNVLKLVQPSLPKIQLWHLLFFFQVMNVPLACVRKLKSLAVTNLLADIAIISCLIYLFGYGLVQLGTNGPSPTVQYVGESSAVLEFMGTMVYAYEGINVVLPIYEAHEKKEQFGKLFGTVLAGITLIFCTFGALWYSVFGAATLDTASLNLPEGIASDVVPLLFAAGCAFTIPILVVPISQEVEPLLFPKATWTNVTQRKWAKNFFRAAVLFFSALIAAVGGNDVQRFLAIIGGCCCGPLAFVLPSSMYIVMCKPTGGHRIFCFGLVFLGLFVSVVATALAVLGH